VPGDRADVTPRRWVDARGAWHVISEGDGGAVNPLTEMVAPAKAAFRVRRCVSIHRFCDPLA
jgi:hypothetical protein